MASGTVVDFNTRKIIDKGRMGVEEAEALVGQLTVDELLSTREICNDDPDIVEACSVLLDVTYHNKG